MSAAVIISCMANRHLNWLRQAEADLAAGKDSLASGHYEWACFSAQQAAEKAVTALFLKRGADAWGHTITPLQDHVSFAAAIDRGVDV